MRPTPAEIAGSMRALLREQMGRTADPDLVPLKRVMAALRDMRWNDAAFDLMAETADLADLIDWCLSESGEDAGARAALDAYRAAPVPRSFAEANAANAALRGVLVALIDRLRAGPDNAAAAAVQARIAATMLALRSAPAPDRQKGATAATIGA